VQLRADFYAQSGTFFSSTNGTATPGTDLDGYETLAMRLTWKEIMESDVSAAFYVRNLTDNVYHISGYALGASNGVNTWYPGEPRTFGGELSIRF
jgi:iron complex outermembrane recepter protein